MARLVRRIRLSHWATAHGMTARAARQMTDYRTLPAGLDPVRIGKF